MSGSQERANSRIARLNHSLRDKSNQGLMTSCCLTFRNNPHPPLLELLSQKKLVYVCMDTLYSIFSAIVLISCIFCLRKII